MPHFVAVHAVDGVEPGLYRWPDLAAPLAAATCATSCSASAATRTSGATPPSSSSAPPTSSALDDRGYREAQLDAGIVEGRLHLAAYALGHRRLGDDVPRLRDRRRSLGEPLAGLLFTCVGVPTYRSRPGGAPGRAASPARPDDAPVSRQLLLHLLALGLLTSVTPWGSSR